MHSKVVMKDKMYPVTYSCYVLLYQLQINLTLHTPAFSFLFVLLYSIYCEEFR